MKGIKLCLDGGGIRTKGKGPKTSKTKMYQEHGTDQQSNTKSHVYFGNSGVNNYTLRKQKELKGIVEKGTGRKGMKTQMRKN